MPSAALKNQNIGGSLLLTTALSNPYPSESTVRIVIIQGVVHLTAVVALGQQRPRFPH